MLQKEAKKRQRVTSSCSVCRTRKTKCDKKRPYCLSCIKASLQSSCKYELPQWIHSTVEKKPVQPSFYNFQVKLEPKEQKPTVESVPSPSNTSGNTSEGSNKEWETENSSAGFDGASEEIPLAGNGDIRRDIHNKIIKPQKKKNTQTDAEKIKQLQAQVKELAYQLSQKNNYPSGPILSSKEVINFTKGYTSTVFKGSSVSSIKSLSHYSFLCRDIFLYHFHVKFVHDYSSVKRMISSMYRSRRAKLENKQAFTMTNEQRHEVKKVIMEIAQKNEFATLIANVLNTHSYSDKRWEYRHEMAAIEIAKAQDEQLQLCHGSAPDLLCETIIGMLPRIEILRYLWKMYILYINPFIPIFDVGRMAREISAVFEGIDLEDQNMPAAEEKKHVKTIKINNRVDFARISIFLICMRLGYLCVKFNINDIQIRCPIEEEMMGISNKFTETETVPPQFATVARVSLNLLKPFKKASYISLVAQILLYNYMQLREEDRAGFGLDQNHMSLSNIITQAKHMGLNRDWSVDEFTGSIVHGFSVKAAKLHFRGTPTEIYYYRKIWYYLMNLDAQTAICEGKLLDIHCEDEFDTIMPTEENSKAVLAQQFLSLTMIPDYVPMPNRDESKVSCKEVEILGLRNMRLQYEINVYLREISKSFNNVRTPVSVVKVVDNISKIDQMLNTTELREEIFFSDESKTADNNTPRRTVADNYYGIIDMLYRLSMNFTLKITKFALNFALFLHYDTEKRSINSKSNGIYFLKQAVQSSFDITMLSREFLLNNDHRLLIEVYFNKVEESHRRGLCYGFKNFNFIILPMVDSMCYRAIIVIESLLLRLVHGLSIIDGIIGQKKSSSFLSITVSIEEYYKKRKLFEEMYTGLYKTFYVLVKLLVDKFAKFYSHSFKETLVYQYYLVCFKNPEIITEWFNKRTQYFGHNNSFINLSISDTIDLKDFIANLINICEEKYPDTICDELISKNFSQQMSDFKEASIEKSFGTTIVPCLQESLGKSREEQNNDKDFFTALGGPAATDFRNLIEDFFEGSSLKPLEEEAITGESQMSFYDLDFNNFAMS